MPEIDLSPEDEKILDQVNDEVGRMTFPEEDADEPQYQYFRTSKMLGDELRRAGVDENQIARNIARYAVFPGFPDEPKSD